MNEVPSIASTYNQRIHLQRPCQTATTMLFKYYKIFVQLLQFYILCAYSDINIINNTKYEVFRVSIDGYFVLKTPARPEKGKHSSAIRGRYHKGRVAGRGIIPTPKPWCDSDRWPLVIARGRWTRFRTVRHRRRSLTACGEPFVIGPQVLFTIFITWLSAWWSFCYVFHRILHLIAIFI